MKVKLEALVGPCTFFFLEVWSGFVSSPGLVRLSFPRSPAILLGEQVSRPHFWTLLASPAQMPSLVDPIDLGTGSAAQSNIQVYRHQPATHFGSGSEPMHTATQSWMYARAQPDTSKLAPSASVPPQGFATTGPEIGRRKAPLKAQLWFSRVSVGGSPISLRTTRWPLCLLGFSEPLEAWRVS